MAAELRPFRVERRRGRDVVSERVDTVSDWLTCAALCRRLLSAYARVYLFDELA